MEKGKFDPQEHCRPDPIGGLESGVVLRAEWCVSKISQGPSMQAPLSGMHDMASGLLLGYFTAAETWGESA